MARRKDAEEQDSPGVTATAGRPLARGSAFAGVEGQDAALNMVKAAMANGRLGHAYLLVGPEGVGRELVARRMAAALLCTGRDGSLAAHEVCGACASCVRVDRMLHPDVHLVLTEAEAVRRGRLEWTEDRKPAQELRVDQVRTLRDALRMTAFEGGWRVAIVPEAHRMRVEAANALLKTLEEPLPRSLLVLCSPDRGAVLETIRSRCQRLNFNPLPGPVVAAILRRDHGVDGPAAEALAVASEGSMARALAQEAERARQAVELAQRIRDALGNAPPSDLLAQAESLEKDRDAMEATIRAFARLCARDAERAGAAAKSEGKAAVEARAMLDLADAALVLRGELARPGANARLGLERFLLGAQLRLQGLTYISMNSNT